MDESSLLCAIRAVWTLYRHGKWNLLKCLGIGHVQVKALKLFDEDQGDTELDWEQVTALIYLMPCVLEAAIHLNGKYLTRRKDGTLQV